MSANQLFEITNNLDGSSYKSSRPEPITDYYKSGTNSPTFVVAAEVKPTAQLIPVNVSDGYQSQNLNSRPAHLPIPFDNIEKQKDLEKAIKIIWQGYCVLIFMRGLPGSGKSHLARLIIDATIGKKSYENHILSTDDYFMKDGRYQFDTRKLDEAHRWNQKRAVKAMSQGVSPIIIDDTNVKLWEMRPYAQMAVDYGYYVKILEPNTPWQFNVEELGNRNRHGVSDNHLKKILSCYQRNVTGHELLCSYNLDYTRNVPPVVRKQPPLTNGINWFSDRYSTVSNIVQVIQQNQHLSNPRVNDVSRATGTVDVPLEDNLHHIITITDDSDDSSVSELATSKIDHSHILTGQNFNKSLISKCLCTNTTAESKYPINVGRKCSRPERDISVHSKWKHSHSPKIQVKQAGSFTSGTTQSWTVPFSDTGDDTDSESEFSEAEEIMELNLGYALVNQLENKFEKELPGYPKGCHPIVQVPLSFAMQLFAFYLESVYQQTDAQKEIIDSMVKQDEELAQQLDEHERTRQKETIKNIRDIMNEQTTQVRYQKDVTESKTLTPDIPAVKLARQQLFNSFPSIDQSAIDQTSHAHNFGYKQRMEGLFDSAPAQYARNIDDVRKPLVTHKFVEGIKDATDALTIQASAILLPIKSISLDGATSIKDLGVAYDPGPRMDLQVSPTTSSAMKILGFIIRNSKHVSHANILVHIQEDAQAKLNGDEWRRKAYLCQSKRAELRKKAHDYKELGMTAIAEYYSEQAAEQTRCLEQANYWAATIILNEHAKRLQNFNTLDIHSLHAKEATTALDVFIDKNVNFLKNGLKEQKELIVITGRGKHSRDGKSVLKPVVTSRLEKRKIRYVWLNPGMLKIFVNKNTRMTTDLP